MSDYLDRQEEAASGARQIASIYRMAERVGEKLNLTVSLLTKNVTDAAPREAKVTYRIMVTDGEAELEYQQSLTRSECRTVLRLLELLADKELITGVFREGPIRALRFDTPLAASSCGSLTA